MHATATTKTQATEVLGEINSKQIKWVDLQFVDLIGGLQHVSIPVHEFGEKEFTNGIGKLDGSSIKGFKEITESDMVLFPVLSTFKQIPWENNTARVFCQVHESAGGVRFSRDSRFIAEKAEAEAMKQGFDAVYFGPELEFFVFDSVKFDASTPFKGQGYSIESSEAAWQSTGTNLPIAFKSGYYPTPPMDTLQEFRRQCCESIQNDFGIPIEAHHHEVATAGQCEIDVRYDAMVNMADSVVTYKYVVKNMAKQAGKIATFMPKPIFGDNASGMHCHQSLWNKGKNMFYDATEQYAGLSQTAIYYLNGLIEHGRAVSAFTSPTTNSYKRLVPGYEAPVYLAYSKRNRSAAIRIPMYFDNEGAKRLEYRPPDPSANPYLAFAAMVAAGLDGIKRKLSNASPVDTNLYHLTTAQRKELGVKELPGSLEEALGELEADHDFLKPIFSQDAIDMYLDIKKGEAKQNAIRPTPFEFQMYLDA